MRLKKYRNLLDSCNGKGSGILRLYRYRNAEKMLNYKELENKNMFFAPSDMQNDPMEGISDIVWNGDYIAWENLFKNYCMNLCQVILFYSTAIVCKEDTIFDSMKKITAGFNSQIPYRYVLTQAANQFVTNEYVILFLNHLINRDVRKYELMIMIKCIHPLALQAALMNLYPDETQYPIAIEKLLQLYDYEKIKTYLSEEENPIKVELFFQKFYSVVQGIITGGMRSEKKHDISKVVDAYLFVINHFTGYYICEITKWCFPNYFMVCFSKNCENSSMWSYYADAHKGVCLIYEISDDNQELVVKKPPAFGIPYGENKKLKFYNIDYQKKLLRIEFFSHCLKILQLKDELRNGWIFNEDGNFSKSFVKMIDDKEGWLKEYEKLVFGVATRKDEDWKHEEEMRLIMPDYWKDEICSTGAAMEYDFSKLVGVIFGINTPEDVKLKVIEALENAKELDDNFEFYQAYYDYIDGKIGKWEIPIADLRKRKFGNK